MDIYLKRKRGKILLLAAAVLIGVASLWYTNWLTGKMAQEERKKVELWAEAIKGFADASIQTTSAEMEQLNTNYLNLVNTIISQNTSIPIIIVNPDGSFNSDANISYKDDRREEVLARELKKMKSYAEPFPIIISEETTQYLYFR
ncbi:MAG TPA: hypothetical protein VKA10_10315, partial [Prolixibacteraceae bacterium]|nr:hypothetical protein [Prolixibacteraceae bacterium]